MDKLFKYFEDNNYHKIDYDEKTTIFNHYGENDLNVYVWITNNRIDAYMGLSNDKEDFEGDIYHQEFSEITTAVEIVTELQMKIAAEKANIHDDE